MEGASPVALPGDGRKAQEPTGEGKVVPWQARGDSGVLVSSDPDQFQRCEILRHSPGPEGAVQHVSGCQATSRQGHHLRVRQARLKASKNGRVQWVGLVCVHRSSPWQENWNCETHSIYRPPSRREPHHANLARLAAPPPGELVDQIIHGLPVEAPLSAIATAYARETQGAGFNIDRHKPSLRVRRNHRARDSLARTRWSASIRIRLTCRSHARPPTSASPRSRSVETASVMTGCL